MTVINGIEIDCINYKQNVIKYAIQQNDPIDDNLHVIIVISNPCLYISRYKLFNEFITLINIFYHLNLINNFQIKIVLKYNEINSSFD